MVKYPYERKKDKMDYKSKILKIVDDNNGYVTTKEITNKGVPKVYLTKLVRARKLVKVSRGFYMLPDCFEDDYFKIQLTNNDAIFSLETALYLYNYSDRIPIKYYVSVPSNYGGNLLKNKSVQLLYTKAEWLNLGVIELTSPFGLPIRVYDRDRTICDIIKNKNKVDPEIFGKAMKRYINSKDKNITNLFVYAKKLKIEEEVRKYIEVMLW